MHSNLLCSRMDCFKKWESICYRSQGQQAVTITLWSIRPNVAPHSALTCERGRVNEAIKTSGAHLHSHLWYLMWQSLCYLVFVAGNPDTLMIVIYLKDFSQATFMLVSNGQACSHSQCLLPPSTPSPLVSITPSVCYHPFTPGVVCDPQVWVEIRGWTPWCLWWVIVRVIDGPFFCCPYMEAIAG